MFGQFLEALASSLEKWGVDGSADPGDFVVVQEAADLAEERVNEEINEAFIKYPWLPSVFVTAAGIIRGLASRFVE
jgi:hypothetical protein